MAESSELNVIQYSCFVEGCERKCLTAHKRRMHLIDKHIYPKNFFFAVTTEGIDGRRSLLTDGGHHQRRSFVSAKQNSASPAACAPGRPRPEQNPQSSVLPKQMQHDVASEGLAELAEAMSHLKFVPSSIRFGRGRAGFEKR